MRILRPLLAALLLFPGTGCAPAGPSLPEGVLPIGAVQGSDLRSPMEGSEVTVQGILTARFEGRGGFFMQSAPGEEDGDTATSDGIFVELAEEGALALSPGDRVRVTGMVVELGSGERTLTALSAREVVALEPAEGAHSPGALLPAPVPVTEPPDSLDEWERWEGMRIRVEAPLTLTGTWGLRRFGEAMVSFDGRLFQPTELHRPGPQADSAARANALRRIVLDDGAERQWPEGLAWREGEEGGWPTAEEPLRAGSVLAPVTGIVDVRRGGYLLLPVEPVEVAEPAPRPNPPALPEVPESDGPLRVAVLNVENLFNGDGMGGGFPTPRGAATPEAHALQQAKLVATLLALDPDVAALSEVENDGVGPRTALSHFVAALNAEEPHGDWAAVEVEGPGTDAIRTALIYRSSRVRPVGSPVVPEDPIFAWGSRPPLGQAFQRVAGPASAPDLPAGTPLGAPWLVVSNHLKSKGGCPGPDDPRARPGDRDQGDGQSCWNDHRTRAAQAMADWLREDPASLAALPGPDGTEPSLLAWQKALVVGDLNSYGREDPIVALEEAGWVDAWGVEGADRGTLPPWSYVFDGQAGRLDHALVHRDQAHRIRVARIWHTNADEDPGFGYEAALERAHALGDAPRATVWRSSDHDPLLLLVRTGWGR